MQTAPPLVTTTAGTVRGTWRGRSAAFLGIPFAAAPVGPLRFAAPGAPDAWSGIRDATSPGPTPQRRPLSAVTTIPEPSVPGDGTLCVDVFTPSPTRPAGRPGNKEGSGLPVLVWIHGGGFTAGSPASPWYDGASFNRDGVVTVTVSYRLGFDGFGIVPGAPPNRGVLDWIAALEWVQENIAEFGGDPTRVTIAGQSAGGGAVLVLMASPRARGLFHRAIAASPAVPHGDREAAERATDLMAAAAGVPATRAGFATLSEEQVLDLQAEVVRVPERTNGTDPGVRVLKRLADMHATDLGFGPVVDGELLPFPAVDALKRGSAVGVPLLVGTTANEFTSMLEDDAAEVDPLGAEKALRKIGLTGGLARAYAHRFPGKSASWVVGQLVTEVVFRIPAVRTAKFHARRSPGSTWLYDFRWVPPVDAGMRGASHCMDLPFAWDLLTADGVARVLGEAPPTELAADVHGAWVAFVKGDSPGWAAYRAPGRVVRVFDTESRTVEDGYKAERRLGRLLSPFGKIGPRQRVPALAASDEA
jgi:para-nitrobenzyl esterase